MSKIRANLFAAAFVKPNVTFITLNPKELLTTIWNHLPSSKFHKHVFQFDAAN